jgi:hypothetical protein
MKVCPQWDNLFPFSVSFCLTVDSFLSCVQEIDKRQAEKEKIQKLHSAKDLLLCCRKALLAQCSIW